jgi:predicted metal-dependent phosphoesterase TrpH
MPEIDLHTHSSASDGSLSPRELVLKAHGIGLKAIALTDHDTTDGLPEALATGRETGIEVIPGCELSVSSAKGSMHILGLWLPEHPGRLETVLEGLRAKRHERNRLIVEKLRRGGINVTYQEVLDLAGPSAVGRPHIARLMVRKNIVSNLEQAFQQFLGAKGSAYVPKEKLTPEQAISLLKEEQATTILAHPFTLNLTGTRLDLEIARLKELGLDGMEAIYSVHSQKQTSEYLNLCRKHDLLVSAGSDFHGKEVKPNIALGTGKGGLRPSYELVRIIKERRAALGLPTP